MKVAIVGGTGSFGLALAKRLAGAGYDVVVGSRDAARAAEAAAAHGVEGAANADACRGADLVVADAALTPRMRAERRLVHTVGRCHREDCLDVAVGPRLLVPREQRGTIRRFSVGHQ